MIKDRPSRERVDESVPGLLEDIASNVRERVVEGEGGGEEMGLSHQRS